MIQLLILVIAIPILVLLTYVLCCAAVYLYEEFCAFRHTAKRKWSHFMWEVKWEWKRFRREVDRWITKS